MYGTNYVLNTRKRFAYKNLYTLHTKRIEYIQKQKFGRIHLDSFCFHSSFVVRIFMLMGLKLFAIASVVKLTVFGSVGLQSWLVEFNQIPKSQFLLGFFSQKYYYLWGRFPMKCPRSLWKQKNQKIFINRELSMEWCGFKIEASERKKSLFWKCLVSSLTLNTANAGIKSFILFINFSNEILIVRQSLWNEKPIRFP